MTFPGETIYCSKTYLLEEFIEKNEILSELSSLYISPSKEKKLLCKIINLKVKTRSKTRNEIRP